MAMNDFNIGFIGGLDGTKSKTKLNQDIDAIKKTLKELELKVKLDPNQVKFLETQLNTLKVNLTDAKFSQSALDGMVSQINNALKGIKIPSVSVGGNANVGQQIGNNIAQGFRQSTNAIESFKKSLSNAGKSSSEIDNIVQKVQKLNVQIDSLQFSESTNGLMNVNVAGLDEFGNKVKITQTLLQDLETMQWNVSNTTTSVVSTKELERINNVFADYTAKLAQFKSTNTNILSGLTQPLADFESKLAGLKNGTVSIDEVNNAFKLLGTEASKITEHFTGQLSKTDAAIRKLAQGDEIMDKLKASFKGLDNVPKEITKELTSVSKLLQNVKNIESKEGRTANWSEAYRKWADEVDKLQAKLSLLQKQQASMTTPQIFKTSDLRSADIPYMTKVSNTIEKQMAEIQKMSNAKGWQEFDVKGVEEADGKIKALTLTVRDAEGALKQFTMQRAKLQGSGKAQTGLMQVGDVKVLETASQAQAKLAQQTENANVKLQEQVNKIQLSFDDGTYEAKYDSLIAKTRQWVDANDESVISTQKLTVAYNEFNTAAANYANDNSIVNRDTLIQKEEELARQIKATTNEVRSQNAEYAKSSKIDSLHQKIQEFYDKNTAAHKKWGSQLKNMLNETAHGAQVTATKVNEIEQGFLGISNAARQTGKLGQSFFGSIKEQASKFIGWFSVTSVVMEGVQSIKKMAQAVIEVDTAMIELTKVSSASSNELKNYFDEAAESAKKLGASVSDVISATADFSRLGYNLKDASVLAEVATLYKNVGDGITIDEASSSIVSTMKAFGIEAENAMQIIDAFNQVGNNFAISSGEIGDALKRSASSLAVGGNSLSEAIGLITAGNTVVQDADIVGTALKSMSLRITSTSAELEAMGEDTEFACETLSDYRDLVMGLTDNKVNIVGDDGEYKSTYEILKDISQVWDDMNSMEQSSLMKALFGVRQANIGASILENFDVAEQAMKSAEESAGSALKEQSNYEKGKHICLYVQKCA